MIETLIGILVLLSILNMASGWYLRVLKKRLKRLKHERDRYNQELLITKTELLRQIMKGKEVGD